MSETTESTPNLQIGAKSHKRQEMSDSTTERHRIIDKMETPIEPQRQTSISTVERSAEPGNAEKSLSATATHGTCRFEGNNESMYMEGFKLYLLTCGLFLAIFVIALDNTIIATAIPRITTVLDSLNDVGWYGSSYLLTSTSLQPSFGKLYTFFNIKWTYVAALLTFELGSILCGAAINSTMLIVGRAVAGIGAAAIFSGGMTIIAHAVPLRKRPIYISILSSTFGIASVVGPILGKSTLWPLQLILLALQCVLARLTLPTGGAFTDDASWRWCFYINLPIGGIAIAFVSLFFQDPKREETKFTLKRKLHDMDFAGALLLIGAIVCLLLALQWGGSVYPWHDSKVWGCITGFGLLIVLFIVVQIHRGDLATLPPRIIAKQRTVLACALFSFFIAMTQYTHLYYLPFYFQAVKGTSAEASGIRTISYLLSMTVASIAAGGLTTAFGIYVPLVWSGSVLLTVGSGFIYTLKVGTSTGTWIGYQILTGFGVGTCVQIPFVAIQVVLNEKDIPVGNVLPIFFNSLGGAIAISVAQNIFSNTLLKEIPTQAPDINAEAVVQAGATHIRGIVTTAQLPGILEAYDIALTTTYILAIACGGFAFLSGMLFEWKTVKKQDVAETSPKNTDGTKRH